MHLQRGYNLETVCILTSIKPMLSLNITFSNVSFKYPSIIKIQVMKSAFPLNSQYASDVSVDLSSHIFVDICSQHDALIFCHQRLSKMLMPIREKDYTIRSS